MLADYIRSSQLWTPKQAQDQLELAVLVKRPELSVYKLTLVFHHIPVSSVPFLFVIKELCKE